MREEDKNGTVVKEEEDKEGAESAANHEYGRGHMQESASLSLVYDKQLQTVMVVGCQEGHLRLVVYSYPFIRSGSSLERSTSVPEKQSVDGVNRGDYWEEGGEAGRGGEGEVEGEGKRDGVDCGCKHGEGGDRQREETIQIDLDISAELGDAITAVHIYSAPLNDGREEGRREGGEVEDMLGKDIMVRSRGASALALVLL
mgnify:CR=1 FL=1